MDETHKPKWKKENIEIINEGLVQIEFPEFNKVSSDAPVFYNPRMEFNRDISILAIQAFQRELNKELDICDVFGGSGIRGIRYKKEINNIGNVAINDISQLANEFTEINAIKNNIEIEESSFEIHQKEANIFLRNNRGKFDIIDIDPFGTPSNFTDSVAYSIKKDALLCITATDTSALCGTYKTPCIRKYNAKPYKSEYCHETGIRILAGFVALTMAKYKKYIEIKMSHSSEHYMRIYMKIKKSSKACDESLENIGYISHCKECLYRESSKGMASPLPEFCPECGAKMIHAGPLWLGEIGNKEFINLMIEISENKKLNNENQILKLLNNCKEEASKPVSFYDVHEISRCLKISAPKIDKVIDKLKEKGYLAVRTHFNPIGIKTNGDINEIKKIVKILAPK